MSSKKGPKGFIECPQVPVFQPTEEEWRTPLEYLASLRRQVEQLGMAKIVPPSGWEPSFTMDRKKTKFKTHIQSIHELQCKDSVAEAKQFWAKYNAFQESAGNKSRRKPLFSGQEIDLYRLYRLVTRRGGYKEVCDGKRWKDIVTAMEIEDKGSNAAYTLKNHYARLLEPFEEHCLTRNKGGAGLLADAMETEVLRDSSQKRPRAEPVDEIEMTAIAEAMLGLGPASRTSSPDGSEEAKEGKPEKTEEDSKPKAKAKSQPKKKRKVSKNGSKSNAPENEDDTPKDDILFSTMVCEDCRGGHYEDKIILCDKCDKGWHLFCLSPPLDKVPKGEWLCPHCEAAKRGDTGQGEQMTLNEFESHAREFEVQWYDEKKAEDIPVLEREEEYWRIVELGEDVAEVLFVNDPKLAAKRSCERDKGLRQVPGWKDEQSQNLVSFLETEVPGLHSCYTQLGMIFSSMPWQAQNHLLYSLSYLHSGERKQWYCIPGYAASMFESVLEIVHPDHVVTMDWASPICPDIMMSPLTLIERGVPVYGCAQEPGSIVVTFPNTYHCSVNLGLNVAESIEFMPPDWMRYASQCISLYRSHRYPPLFCHEKLILDAIESIESLGFKSKYWLSKELARVLQEETILRFKLWSEGLVRSRRVPPGDPIFQKRGKESSSDEQQASKATRVMSCCICRSKLALSAVECECSGKNVACLHHRQQLCRCHVSKQRLAWQYSLLDIQQMLEKLESGLDKRMREEIENEETVIKNIVQASMKETFAKRCEIDEERREDIMKNSSHNSGKKLKNRTNGKNSQHSEVNNKEVDLACMQPGTPLTFVTSCGYVQGPLRPFAQFDLYPEDFESIDTWKEGMEKGCKAWIYQSQSALNEGGNKADELPDLVEEADQYLWGGVNADLTCQVASLVPELRKADEFMEKLWDALDGRPTLEEAEAILQTDPLPIKSPSDFETLNKSIKNAKEWLAKYKYAYEEDAEPMDSKALDAIVAEATRIPITISEAKDLKERLSSIKKVADAVRTALPTNREAGRRKKDEEQPTLEYLEELQTEAIKARIMMPEIVNLNNALQKVATWRDRVATVLKTKPRWHLIEELIEDALNMPCSMPDVDALFELRDKINIWIHDMRLLIQENAPLKKLRDTLQAGYSLPLEFQEIDELRIYVQKTEWEESARKMISTKAGLHVYEEMLVSSEAAGITDIELVESIRLRVNLAKSWMQKAQLFEESCLDASCNPPKKRRCLIQDLRELVLEGEASGVKMESLARYSEQLSIADKWLQSAKQFLHGIEIPIQSPELILSKEPIVNVDSSLINPLVRYKNVWLKDEARAKMPQYEIAKNLIMEYETKLNIEATEIESLKSIQGRVLGWLKEAEPILSQSYVVDDEIPILESLIKSGLKTGVNLAEVGILEANVEALLWAQTVRGILAHLAEPYNGSPQYLSEDARASNPSASLLNALKKYGEILPCDKELLAKFKAVLSASMQWSKEAQSIVRVEKPKNVTLEYLIDFLTKGKELKIDFPELEKVQSKIESHIAWEREVAQMLTAHPVRYSLQAFKDIYTVSLKSPIKSKLKEDLSSAMKEADGWISETRGMLGGSLSQIPLVTCFECIENSVDAALEQFERRLEMERRLAGSERGAGNQEEQEDEGELYCLCQQTIHADSSMTSCDLCGEWYHNKCIGLKAKNITKYECPLCHAITTYHDPIDSWVRKLKVKVIEFPQKADLEAVLKRAKSLKVLVPEEEKLDELMSKYEQWMNIATGAMEAHHTSPETIPDGGTEPSISEGMLRQICKSALAIEIDGSEIAQQVLKILRLKHWQGIVTAFLDAVSQSDYESEVPILTQLEDLLNKAKLLCINLRSDSLGRKIQASYDAGIQWKRSMDKCVEDMKAAETFFHHGFFEIQREVLQTIKTGENLPLPLVDDLELLKEYSRAYCLCRKVFHEDATMLQCDGCKEWFHFPCVGLRDPDHYGTVPEHFTCPICCIGTSSTYDHFHKIPDDCMKTLSEIAFVLPYIQAAMGDSASKDALSILNSAAYQYLFHPTEKNYNQAVSNEADSQILRALYPTFVCGGLVNPLQIQQQDDFNLPRVSPPETLNDTIPDKRPCLERQIRSPEINEPKVAVALRHQHDLGESVLPTRGSGMAKSQHGTQHTLASMKHEPTFEGTYLATDGPKSHVDSDIDID